MTTMEDAIRAGQVIDGRYHVLGKLGEGGMANVYRATDRKLQRDVVIKVPRASMLEQAEFARRFAMEVRSLIKLENKDIVQVLDVGEHEGCPFVVMTYLSGGSLRERMGRRSRPTVLQSDLTWVLGIASALDFLHAKGYVHRDVKPDNILFDAEGHAYLGDFGIAKALGRHDVPVAEKHTVPGMIIGTPRYMAPEVLQGRTFDGRADQYSLGVTVLEFLSGQCPGDGPALSGGSLPEAGLPAAVREVLHTAMHTDPAGRYTSCTWFAKMLLNALPLPTAVPCPPPLPPVAAASGPPMATVAQQSGETPTVETPGLLRPSVPQPNAGGGGLARTVMETPAHRAAHGVDIPRTVMESRVSGPRTPAYAHAPGGQYGQFGAALVRHWKWVVGGCAGLAALIVVIILLTRGGGSGPASPSGPAAQDGKDRDTITTDRKGPEAVITGRKGAIGSADGKGPDTVTARQLPGTIWTGNESLKGFGKLEFHFLDHDRVNMLDAKGVHGGQYTRNGENVTLTFFSGEVVYFGTIRGATMQGSARNTRAGFTWSWEVACR